MNSKPPGQKELAPAEYPSLSRGGQRYKQIALHRQQAVREFAFGYPSVPQRKNQ